MSTNRAAVTEAYAVIPRRVMTDIVTSFLPNWDSMRMWVLARPMSGFAETFSHYLVDIGPNSGCDQPETNTEAQCVLYVDRGEVTVEIGDEANTLGPGGYAYLPAGTHSHH